MNQSVFTEGPGHKKIYKKNPDVSVGVFSKIQVCGYSSAAVSFSSNLLMASLTIL